VQVRVRVPASTSNLGPGFDCLGLALDLYLEVVVERTDRGLSIENSGSSPSQATRGDDLVYAALARTLRRRGAPERGLRIVVRSEIPVARGLGSSAAAILGGLLAGHLLAHGEAPDPPTILAEAVEIEGHPDNIAPALLGGLVACAVTEQGRVHALRLPLPPDLGIVLVIPDVRVPTARARQILPAKVPLADAVFGLSRLALLLGSLATGDLQGLREAMRDRLHQPHRLGLVPGLGGALEALAAEPGCLGAALSGSGPTLLAVVRGDRDDLGGAATEVLRRHGVESRIRRVRPAPNGAAWERLARDC
jgi:homoserine kinase